MDPDPRFELAHQIRRLVRTMRGLAEYARELEVEIDGMSNDPEAGESWGGEPLVKADSVLADFTYIKDADDD